LIIKDLHNHTIYSDGRLTPEEVFSIAEAKGYQAGISDHCGEGSFQINRDIQFKQYLNELDKWPVLRSVELDLGTEIAISARLLQECDYLIGGIHSLGELNFFDNAAGLPDAEKIIGQMLDLIERKSQQFEFHILAHPGLLPVALRSHKEKILGKEWSQRLVELALKYDFALEISSRWELPSIDTIKVALNAGAMFSLGSDGHCQDSTCNLKYSLAVVDQLKIPEKRIFAGKRSAG